MNNRTEGLLVHVVANIVIVFVVGAVLLGSLSGLNVIITGGKNRAIYNGNTAEPRVSLMVNVYWGQEYIPDMLAVFDRFDAKATFFIGGCWAAANPQTVKSIHEAGHELGNHGYLHKDHKGLSVKQNKDEILLTQSLIEQITGFKTTLFAPPSGSIGNNLFTVCDELDYKVIMFNKDTIDWRDKDPDLVYMRATKNAANGDLILMHPSAHTLSALPRILGTLREKGFDAVTVSENLSPSLI